MGKLRTRRYNNTRVLQRSIKPGDGKFLSNISNNRKRKFYYKYYL